jgi:hypothetical protein
MIEPFGDNNGIASPLDLGVQTFLGLTVVDFAINSSWTPEGGQCNITLIQDDGQYLSPLAVAGSPQYFEIVSNAGEPIFRFYGILSKISRDVNQNSKTYTATLQSPTILLDACALILDSYAGKGSELEAYGPNVPTCIPYGSKNSSLNTSSIFNIQNLFGVFENSAYGATGAGFGRSVINKDGMRIDFFSYALDLLLNGTALTPDLGSNIIYGCDTYDLTSSKAFAYNFDVVGFLSSIASFIPNDYRVTATTIMDFVDKLCADINHVYYIDLLKPPGSGNPAFGSSHESSNVPNLTHANTIYGGQIIVKVQNRNTSLGVKFPLSQNIIKNEGSDKLGGVGQTQNLPLDIGVEGSFHPDGPPVASPPYGEFPVEEITSDNTERYSSTNLSVNLTQGAVAAKYITGGFQSRMNYVSTYLGNDKNPEIYDSNCSPPPDVDNSPNVYCYWGEINLAARLNLGEESTIRNVPIITPFLFGDYEFHDFILIDIFDLVGNTTMGATGASTGAVFNGIYPCSLRELRHAMTSYESWISFMEYNKAGKLFAIQVYFEQANASYIAPLYNADGTLTFEGFAAKFGGLNSLHQHTTATKQISRPACSNLFDIDTFLKSLHGKISSIGDEHYGQSFAVKMPVYSIKSDNEYEAPLNSFIKSWQISDSAYIDPPNYIYYEAPNGVFVRNGRVAAYANFEANFNSLKIPYGPYSQELNIPLKFVGNYDFSGYQSNEVLTQIYGANIINSVLTQVNPEYLLVPPSYFTSYSLLLMPPLSSEVQRLNILPQMIGCIDYIKQLKIDENGIGMTPFALAKIKRVLVPSLLNGPDNPYNYMSQFTGVCQNGNLNQSQINDQDTPYPVHGVPKSFGIPQQSTRYVYGPWVTNISLPYGAKIEYVKDESLVPENYIIPGTITINGIDYTILSGYEGMNQIGQLMADSVENFDYLFTEEATIEIPGYPKITHIGQALIDGGPLVSDISININANSVSTKYGMKTFAPKFGRANQFIIRSLSNLAKQISAVQKVGG